MLPASAPCSTTSAWWTSNNYRVQVLLAVSEWSGACGLGSTQYGTGAHSGARMSPNLRPEDRHIFVVEVTLTWLGRLAAVVTIVTTLTKCGRRSGTGFCAHSLLLYAATDTRSHRTGHPILHLVPGARLGRPLKH